jgi:phosphinothricin acetyltransferase
MQYSINKMLPGDWMQVRRIYQEGMATGHATFEKEVPEWAKWNSTHLLDCRMVARDGAKVIGWAGLTPVSSRRVYSGVAEVSLYVSTAKQRQGVGSALLNALIADSEKSGVWTLQAGIFPENKASLALVKKNGFCEVGRRDRLAKMTYGPLAGLWRNVVLLERRSQSVGIK